MISFEQVESQPDSIEQLFERFSTPEYKRKQRELWEHVRGSYQASPDTDSTSKIQYPYSK